MLSQNRCPLRPIQAVRREQRAAFLSLAVFSASIKFFTRWLSLTRSEGVPADDSDPLLRKLLVTSIRRRGVPRLQRLRVPPCADLEGKGSKVGLSGVGSLPWLAARSRPAAHEPMLSISWKQLEASARATFC